MVSEIDRLLFNQFSSLELCKLRLDFLSILCLKKEFMYQNFDEETKKLVYEFEKQSQNYFRNDDYFDDIRSTV